MSIDREESRYIRELKKQIQKLKRENQQMRKRMRGMEAIIMAGEIDGEDNDIETPNVSRKHADKEKSKDTCLDCQSEDIIVFELRGLSYYRCQQCESKGKLKNSNKYK